LLLVVVFCSKDREEHDEGKNRSQWRKNSGRLANADGEQDALGNVKVIRVLS